MSSTKKPKSPKTPPSDAPETVTLIGDPYGIRTAEIAEAQNDSDAIDESLPVEDLLESAPDSTEVLENLAGAMEREAERHEAETVQLAQKLTSGESAQEAAERLAREISEDEILRKELITQELSMDAPEEIDPELQAALPQGLDQAEMESCIETLLFLSDKPISIAKLREHLGPDFPKELFEAAVEGLQERYSKPHHGIELVKVAGGLQLRTKPGRAPLARRLARVQTQKLSSGAMETLAIVAFRQPVMKEDIDQIRGVDSSYFVRGLLDRKLIEINGRSELPGRPMLYTTTQHFLELFGLNDLQGLPPLRELEAMIPASQAAPNGEEDPRVKQMRALVAQMKSDQSTSLIYDPAQDEALLQEIRERVSGIPTSTPYLDAQKQAEKMAKEAAHEAVSRIPEELAAMTPLEAFPVEASPAETPATELTKIEPISAD